MLNIILLGEPASGKATQAKFLAKKYNLFDFDMGRELRLARKKDKRIDRSLKRTTDHGKLTPTSIVRQILKERIFKTKKNKGILFDGHPKMIGEAKLAHKWLKQKGSKESDILVLYISIPYEEVVKRMLGREEYFKGKYSKRADDNEKALRNRAK